MTPEKNVQNRIEAYLKTVYKNGQQCLIFRRQAGGFSYKMGLPDLWCLLDGKHIEIEVKRPGGQQSSMQKKWEERLKNAGALYICADSVDQVKEFIKKKFF